MFKGRGNDIKFFRDFLNSEIFVYAHANYKYIIQSFYQITNSSSRYVPGYAKSAGFEVSFAKNFQ